MNEKEKQVYDIAIKACRIGTLRNNFPNWDENRIAKFYVERYRESINKTPQWVTQLGNKIDKFTDEVTKHVAVNNTIKKMNQDRYEVAVKQQRFYGAPYSVLKEGKGSKFSSPFSPHLYGEGTTDIIAKNDHTLGAYNLKKNSILSKLTSLGIETSKLGIYSNYKKALSLIIQRLKGNREDTVYDALSNFVETYKEKIKDVPMQLDQQIVNETVVAQEINQILSKINSSVKDREI